MNRVIYALPLLMLLVLAIVAARAITQKVESAKTQRPIPEINYVLYTGTTEATPIPFTTDSLRGKAQIVNIFATWCPPCVAEHENLVLLAQKYKIPITGIAYSDDVENIKSYLNKLGNPYTQIAMDKNGRSFFDWGASGMPESFVIDKQGIIRYHYSGVITQDIAEKVILPVFQEISQE